jgi:hypothetical protein
MSDTERSPGESPFGRRKGIPNKDKAELRALVQESVFRFTEAKRAADIASGMDPLLAQPVYENYDPVVEMAIAAVDRSNPADMRQKCNAEVAQYLRPKLKSIEITEDPEALELQEEKLALARQLTDMLDLKAMWKKRMAAAEAVTEEPPTNA